MKKYLSILLTLALFLTLPLGAASAADEPIPLNGTGSSPDDPLFDPSLGLTLTFYTTNDYGEDGMPDLEMVKEWIEARTGLTLNFIYTSSDNMLEKMNLVFLSGDSYDGFTIANIANTRSLQSMYNDGLIIDIAPYLETYGKNLMKYLGDGFDYVKSTDGAVLSIPKRVSNHRGWTPIIRADWVEAAGLDHLPTTIEELEAVFEYVKNNDVNGNGDPNDEICILPIGYGNLANTVKGIFLGKDGVSLVNEANYLTEDGVVTRDVNHPYFMEYLKTLRRWYEKGYLYPEFLTVTSSQMQDMITADRVCMPMQWYSAQVRPFRTVEEADPSKHYELLPMIESPIEGVTSYYSEGTTYQGVIQVSATSEHPEVVVAYFDWMLSDPEINCTVWNGLKDVHWVWADEENFVFSSIGDAQTRYYKCFNGMAQFDAEDQFLYANPDEYVAIKYDLYLKDMNNDTRRYAEAFDLKVPYSKIGTDLEFMSNDGNTLLDESINNFILGTLDEAGMKAAIEEYNAIYGDVYSQVYTAQYNEWLASR